MAYDNGLFIRAIGSKEMIIGCLPPMSASLIDSSSSDLAASNDPPKSGSQQLGLNYTI
jgi:hypothetical protein